MIVRLMWSCPADSAIGKQHSSVPCFTGSVAGYMNKECSCDYLVSLNDRIQTKLNTLDSTNTSECISALLHLLGEHGLATSIMNASHSWFCMDPLPTTRVFDPIV